MATIIDVDLEENNLSDFDSTVTDAGDLSVTAGAALNGTSYGLSCLIDDTTSIYGAMTSLNNTTGVSIHNFYLDPNGMTVGASGGIVLLALYNNSSQLLLTLELQQSGGNYYLLLEGYNDAGSAQSGSTIQISDGPHRILIRLSRASSDVAGNGAIYLWVDGYAKSAATVTTIDNYDRFSELDEARLGAQSVPSGSSGTFYLDEWLGLDADNDLLGPISGLQQPQSTHRVGLVTGELNRPMHQVNLRGSN